MDWFQPLNNYCERQFAGFWGEPVNALTNLTFIILGMALALKTKTNKFCFYLSMQIIFIGIASLIFHTFANSLGALLDVLSIIVFGTTYIFAVNLCFLNAGYFLSFFIAILLVPFSFVVSFLTVAAFGDLNGSSWYISFVILFLIYAFLMREISTQFSRVLIYSTLFFLISIIFRSIDQAFCNIIPVGTHFIWHIMNGILLSLLVWSFYRLSDPNLEI